MINWGDMGLVVFGSWVGLIVARLMPAGVDWWLLAAVTAVVAVVALAFAQRLIYRTAPARPAPADKPKATGSTTSTTRRRSPRSGSGGRS